MNKIGYSINYMQKKERNSSVELLRIIAMAMVLLTHYNWSMLGAARSYVDFDTVGG